MVAGRNMKNIHMQHLGMIPAGLHIASPGFPDALHVAFALIAVIFLGRTLKSPAAIRKREAHGRRGNKTVRI
jgi:hypothetical protein